jgi:hypothetical protein
LPGSSGLRGDQQLDTLDNLDNLDNLEKSKTRMATTHILVDLENVQPDGFELLKDLPGARVTVFVCP